MSAIRLFIAESLKHDAQFEASLRDIRSRFAEGGEVLFAARNTIKQLEFATAEGSKTMVVKRFRKPNIFQRLYYTLACTSKARKAFHNGCRLLERGMQTPAPYACVEIYECGLLAEYYYLCDRLDAAPIADGLPVYGTEAFNQRMADDFGVFVAQLHERGILHYDLNSTNVRYILQPDGHYAFSLIDINRMKFCAEGATIPLADCLENMTRFTGRVDIVEYVAHQYAIARQMDDAKVAAQAVAAKLSHDAAWRRKKRLAHPFRNN